MKAGVWISFADKYKPRGHMFVGVAIVAAEDSNNAVARCIDLGIWPKNMPGLDIGMVPVDLDNYDSKYLDRMLTMPEAEELGRHIVVRRRE